MAEESRKRRKEASTSGRRTADHSGEVADGAEGTMKTTAAGGTGPAAADQEKRQPEKRTGPVHEAGSAESRSGFESRGCRDVDERQSAWAAQ